MKNCNSKPLFTLFLTFFLLSCGTQNSKQDVDQISNESQQDSKNNYNELKFLFENKKYEDAYTLLDDMKSNLPYSRYTKHGKILEIHSYYNRNKFAKAIDKSNAFIKKHPLHKRLDYILYLRATSAFQVNKPIYQNISQIPSLIAVNRSKVRQTFSYFSELAQKYPKSSYFKEAIKKIKKLRNILAAYELNDAYLLFDTAKYEEVIKRIDYLIKNYSRTKSIPNALKLQAKVYRLLGQVETARSIESNLRRNHAN